MSVLYFHARKGMGSMAGLSMRASECLRSVGDDVLSAADLTALAAGRGGHRVFFLLQYLAGSGSGPSGTYECPCFQFLFRCLQIVVIAR